TLVPYTTLFRSGRHVRRADPPARRCVGFGVEMPVHAHFSLKVRGVAAKTADEGKVARRIDGDERARDHGLSPARLAGFFRIEIGQDDPEGATRARIEGLCPAFRPLGRELADQ